MKKFILPVVLLLIISCSSNEGVKDYTQANEEEILEYISENNLQALKSDSGLYYVINEPGTGEQPLSSSNVTVAYKGYYSNGTVFDKSDEEGITFNLRGVIAGWTEGITYFKEGGSGVLLIPSRLAYGSDDYKGIPGGSVLIFDVTLIAVN
ncbi:FKBP-type peptidyl-prolyl cis-trans isomerase [Mariniflexile aquimaris]|uniref:Peptidyl-prolyl cis-trans isomerase n=1 Tax=Mariniflexile aquimaris TaxID=881009 RepID=A0ABW3BUF3_9FLAO